MCENNIKNEREHKWKKIKIIKNKITIEIIVISSEVDNTDKFTDSY